MLALLYSILVLIVVRLRARGELDIYDEGCCMEDVPLGVKTGSCVGYGCGSAGCKEW